MPATPTISLNTGASIPQLGFGTWQIPPEDTADVVVTALEVGYRSIDTAAGYHNEAGVGQAIARSGLARDELFVTTKLSNDDHGRERAPRAFEASLEKLGLDYVDLYLIHWPRPGLGLYVETWRVLEELLAGGRARAIGVSNFQPNHLRRLLDETATVPAVNQIELHPRLQQAGLRRLHAELGIATESWSPLAQGAVLDDPTIVRIADAHGRTPAQVVLRWNTQLGNIVIPKSVTPARMAENRAVFDFELSDADMEAIAALDAGQRTGPDPDSFG
jgi:2,5-diketo-D-gluconate reductase A